MGNRRFFATISLRDDAMTTRNLDDEWESKDIALWLEYRRDRDDDDDDEERQHRQCDRDRDDDDDDEERQHISRSHDDDEDEESVGTEYVIATWRWWRGRIKLWIRQSLSASPQQVTPFLRCCGQRRMLLRTARRNCGLMFGGKH